MTLEQKLQNLPASPGIYQYFDKNGKILYIGKAKILKNRVKSYFKFIPSLQPAQKLSTRIHKMISEVMTLDYVLVENENDALILENSLIKQLKPKYNILLRDDKTYPYIYIDLSQDFPRLEITRKVIKGKNIKYFGPYSTGGKDILDSIYELVQLVQKKSCLKSGKACLFYQIKKCKAPCEGKIKKKEYDIIVQKALFYIQNKNILIKNLTDKMNHYSEDFRFEEALILRNRIKTIQKSYIKSALDIAKFEDYDIFVVDISMNRAVIFKMFIRNGKVTSSNHNYINIGENTKDLNEIYKRAIVNYYNSSLPFVPSDILVGHTLEEVQILESFISKQNNKGISILAPKIGIKKQLIEIAFKNCTELLKQDKKELNVVYNDIKNLFGLDKVATRYECFDNSHMMGQANVGAMIVWDENEFIKSDYRLYTLKHQDEYGQMRELLTRRVKTFEENPAPDVWIIDGGLTLLKLAHDICNSVGVSIDIIAISKEKIDFKAHRAKGQAKDILHTLGNNFKLEPSDKRLQFFQRLRDEAHRCAIGFHKKTKRKEDRQISLLNIKGIGPAKVQRLLNFFATFENIEKSTLNEIKEVLNEKDSILVWNHYNMNGQ